MTELTSPQKDFCLYAGLFGIIMGVVCFIQHFFVWGANAYTFLLEATSVVGITTSAYLMLRKKETGVLLIVASSLLFARLLLFIWLTFIKVAIVFNLMQILFFIYMLVIMIIYHINGYSSLLKKISEEKNSDDAFWNNALK